MNKELFKQYNNKTPKFTLNGTNTYGRLISLHDGDSITVILPLYNNFYKFNIRLNNIDTCEMNSKLNNNIELAFKARNRLFELITNKTIDNNWKKKQIDSYLNDDVYLIWLECLDFDKYGRILANIKIQDNDNETLSNILLNEKLAYLYNGGKKESEENQLQL
jgi:endonuclease YncB( thermonuclease family)